MKTKPTSPCCPEAEAYFARKNARRKWWAENWDCFILYPLWAFIGVAGLGVVMVALYSGGKFLHDKANSVEIEMRESEAKQLRFQVDIHSMEIQALKSSILADRQGLLITNAVLRNTLIITNY